MVFGVEHFFGGGLFFDSPGQTHYGTPIRTIELGQSGKSQAEFLAWLEQARARFRMADYDLIR